MGGDRTAHGEVPPGSFPTTVAQHPMPAYLTRAGATWPTPAGPPTNPLDAADRAALAADDPADDEPF